MQTDAPLEDDILAPAFNDDPHPRFARLRAEDPVHWSEPNRAWILTRYDDNLAAFMDPRLSSDRAKPLLQKMGQDERRTHAAQVIALMEDWMVVTDPPVHTRLRRLAARAFNPRRVAAMEPRIGTLVDELLDDFVAGGHEDLVEHFSFPLPAIVIAELIGSPPEDRELFKTWSQQLGAVAFGAGGEGRSDRHEVAMRGLEEMLDYFGGLIEEARTSPGENMIGDLFKGDGKGDRLSETEMKGMCALMLFGGHETTTNTIASTVHMLLTHPEQLALLQRDPQALAGSTVEEGLRYEGAIKILHRWVTEDLELRGKQIKAGERVFLSPTAANRDPEKFPDPDRVDITRTPNPHMAFGKGIHACIGAQLARIEMRVAVAKLVERLPGLRLAEPDAPLRWARVLAARAPEELRVHHDA